MSRYSNYKAWLIAAWSALLISGCNKPHNPPRSTASMVSPTLAAQFQGKCDPSIALSVYEAANVYHITVGKRPTTVTVVVLSQLNPSDTLPIKIAITNRDSTGKTEDPMFDLLCFEGNGGATQYLGGNISITAKDAKTIAATAHIDHTLKTTKWPSDAGAAIGLAAEPVQAEPAPHTWPNGWALPTVSGDYKNLFFNAPRVSGQDYAYVLYFDGGGKLDPDIINH